MARFLSTHRITRETSAHVYSSEERLRRVAEKLTYLKNSYAPAFWGYFWCNVLGYLPPFMARPLVGHVSTPLPPLLTVGSLSHASTALPTSPLRVHPQIYDKCGFLITNVRGPVDREVFFCGERVKVRSSMAQFVAVSLDGIVCRCIASVGSYGVRV